jgi:hypothetical protein
VSERFPQLDRADIARILAHLMPELPPQRAANWRGVCRLHGDAKRDSFAINVDENGKWICHGCDQHGDIYTLVSLMEGFTKPKQALDYIRERLNMPEEATPKPPAAKPDRLAGHTLVSLAPTELDQVAKTNFRTKYGLPEKGVGPWDFLNADGRLLRREVRFHDKKADKPGKPGKAVLPFTTWRSPDGKVITWENKDVPAPRPLYHLDQLAARPDALVLVVEGAKTADAAGATFPDAVVTTWPGGSGGPGKADWSALAGRSVTFWPDKDQPDEKHPDGAGLEAARKAAGLALAGGAAEVRIVDVPDGLPHGWDLADFDKETTPDWMTPELARELVANAPAWAPTPQLATPEEAAPAAQGFDIDTWLSTLDENPTAEELSEHLKPVWRHLAEVGDRTLQDQWKEEIAGRFKLGRDAIRADIKAAEKLVATERAAQRKQQFEAERKAASAEAREGFGLDLEHTRYGLSRAGVCIYKSDNPDAEPDIITPRPFWPMGEGRDLATGISMVKLRWQKPGGEFAEQWCNASITTDREALRKLDGAPLDLMRLPQVSMWLLDAQSCLLPGRKGLLVTSKLGWVDLPEGRRYVRPGDPFIEYTGVTKPTGGTLEQWADGLRMLVSLGEAGYIGLACVGLSAAAPLCRFIKKRNPVITLAHRSGTGKGSVLEFAVSVWGDWEDYTVQAIESTVKGVQNKGRALNDVVLWVDDLHQIHKDDPRKAENAIFYMGTGLARTVATKDGGIQGGERRYGPGLIATEYALGEMMQGGAQNRTIEITDRPLPENQAASALLKNCARDNPGTVAPFIAELVQRDQETLARDIEEDARAYREAFPGLQGDDQFTIALVDAGLVMLMEATGVELPEGVGQWLAAKAAGDRNASEDEHKRAFDSLIALVMSARWEEYDGGGLTRPAREAQINGMTIAWRQRPAGGWLDINPSHPQVLSLMRNFGGLDRHRKEWADRGWMLRQDGRPGWKREGFGRVIRVPEDVAPAPRLPGDDFPDFPSQGGEGGKVKNLFSA